MTGKRWRVPLPQGPEARCGVRTGQILILFALFLTAMVGMLGLATDLGVTFAGRRSVQNAADAGALAGARIVARSTASAPLSALKEVTDVVGGNATKLVIFGAIDCTYRNDSDDSLGSCASTVPSGATGVRVKIVETHSTYFIRAIPGVPKSASTSAFAIAHVRIPRTPSDGPFLPCGIKTWLSTSNNKGNTTLDILNSTSGGWAINPKAIGQTFVIHSSSLNKCGNTNSSYKGLAIGQDNVGLTAPNWFTFDPGTKAGQVSADVDGANGCKAGQVIDNCVVFLPIAIDTPPAADKQMWVVAFAPFFVTMPDPNTHFGVLLSDYIISGKGSDSHGGWKQGYTGAIVIRLTS